jgi:hypothetical protein
MHLPAMTNRNDDSWRETDFERWFDVHPYLPDGERILVVGRHQPVRRMVDLIGLDRDGGLVIMEVANGPSDQRALGQALENLAHYENVSTDTLVAEDEEGGQEALREAFVATFGTEPPEIRARRRVFLVAPSHDGYSAVGTRFLSKHLSSDQISIQLLRATKSPGGFALEELESPAIQRTAALGRTFAVSARGRLFYILEPGPAPVVWSVGRLREGDTTVVFKTKPPRRALRVMKWRLMPIPPPDQTDLSHSGSVWVQRFRPDRFAKVVGALRSTEGEGPELSRILFAAFRGDEFRDFRMVPAGEFFAQWALSDRTLPDWRAIARLAEEQAESRKAARRAKKKAPTP